ncbi:hypothetical protein M409DRAFT_22301 [Zasmidium cellare ATCC 36951]|uniref:Uncharacterized protein n=1 Tax=Zasmidium cellare ATCC 36951 TaxID=1080233 RepID=A0A6A6CNJ7_ZASCE|nr:uncharacterized protein M409DRAFT_22301 [Zasmidium cellare ATCC 36951]KAF2167492.1 hypothetical protein M409DRAFT_22301 [Zasmidium cellare ATCC 36951]
MRLINIRTEKLEDFVGGTPAYAILSHRWTNDEPTFQQYKADPLACGGNTKIRDFCRLVRDSKNVMHGLPQVQWAWVDTVCIDKTSSAELSEAINSMWDWYKRAKWCVAYLSDVSVQDLDLRKDRDIIRHSIQSSEWFTRGWTLQELLAPQRVAFYSKEWSYLGSKSPHIPSALSILRDPLDIVSTIEIATSIDGRILRGHKPVQWASVAQRMSWASRRSTSRPEDAAYCLLGLFDLKMPLLYGEGGPNAFRRLQEQILHESDDDSIFAFQLGSMGAALADSPEDFKGCEYIERVQTKRRKSYVVVHQRLILSSPAIQVKNIRASSKANRRQFLIRLDCVKVSPNIDTDRSQCKFQLIGLQQFGDQFRRRQGIVNSVKDMTKAEVDEKVRKNEWSEVEMMDFSIPISWRIALWRRGRHDLRAPPVQTFTGLDTPYFGGILAPPAGQTLFRSRSDASSDEDRTRKAREAFLNLMTGPEGRLPWGESQDAVES